jgi:hypothetical protein
VKSIGLVLLHVDGDGLCGGDEFVVLVGAGHGDLVLTLRCSPFPPVLDFAPVSQPLTPLIG